LIDQKLVLREREAKQLSQSMSACCVHVEMVPSPQYAELASTPTENYLASRSVPMSADPLEAAKPKRLINRYEPYFGRPRQTRQKPCGEIRSCANWKHLSHRF
jgi:hypothetical protein